MMQPSPVRLSKSKIAAFEHCPKRLWLQVHRRAEGRFDEATLTRFRFGHDVGKRARLITSGGILIDTGMDTAVALAKTEDILRSGHRRPIFEAAFQYANTLVRVDILMPVRTNAWNLVEVKASARVGSYHLADIASQVWVSRGAGMSIDRATIRHLAGPINWRRPDIASVRFQDVDVTNEIEPWLKDRSVRASEATKLLNEAEPQRPMGSYCHRPLACEFREYCSRAGKSVLPENRGLL